MLLPLGLQLGARLPYAWIHGILGEGDLGLARARRAGVLQPCDERREDRGLMEAGGHREIALQGRRWRSGRGQGRGGAREGKG